MWTIIGVRNGRNSGDVIDAVRTNAEDRQAGGVNGGAKAGHWGGVKVGHIRRC
jgi:hypothetical protein